MHATDVRLWRIYFVESCIHVKPEPKPKYVVTVGKNGTDQFWAFLINSKIGKFIANRPELLPCEAAILAEQHRILKHDSFIDCTSLYSFYAWDFQSHKGAISAETLKNLLQAVQDCPVLKGKDKAMILKNSNDFLDSL